MKQEEIDTMMTKIDKRCKLPKHWNDFIEKETKRHHYILKDTKNKICYCTNCHHTFYDKTIKIKDFRKCPNCNNEYNVASINCYVQDFKKSVNLVQRMDKQIIIRVFEIVTFYNDKTKSMENDIEEYCRIIPGKGKFLSDSVWFYMGYMRIYHYSSGNASWRSYNGVRFFSDNPVYPFNKKKLLNGTIMQYAPIEEFVIRFYPCNFLDCLEFAAYESFELLWNMKLYNLCFSSKRLNKNGSFYKRFGISKDYLKFMQDNNLDFKQLQLLKLFKKKNIELINECYNCNFNDVKFLYKEGILEDFINYGNNIYPGNIKTLKEIQEFIPLKKLRNYPKGLKNLDIYKDYLKMSKKLALNYKSKKDLYPRNLVSRHDKMQKKIKVTEDIKTQFGAYLSYLKLSKYTYEDDKYMIFPAPSIDSLKDEGRQQGNCVGNMYITPYVNGETEIFFIRKLENITESFITLEFKNGKVQQKELPHHSRDFSEEQLSFIEKWCQYRAFVDKRDKYQAKNKKKIIQYDLKKLVA